MATVTPRSFTLRPETERHDLLFENEKVRTSTSASRSRVRGGIGFSSGGKEEQCGDGDEDQGEVVDPWLVELPYAPTKFYPPLKFVKPDLSYEDVNGYQSGLFQRYEDEHKEERDFEPVSESD